MIFHGGTEGIDTRHGHEMEHPAKGVYADGSTVRQYGRIIGQAFGPDALGGPRSVAEADALLWAAASDLLVALERLTDRFAFDGVPEDGEEQYAEAIAAIRKARGE